MFYKSDNYTLGIYNILLGGIFKNYVTLTNFKFLLMSQPVIKKLNFFVMTSLWIAPHDILLRENLKVYLFLASTECFTKLSPKKTFEVPFTIPALVNLHYLESVRSHKIRKMLNDYLPLV